jgi:flagellar protein FlgJ
MSPVTIKAQTSPAATPAGASSPADKAALKKAAQGFEAIFLRQMIGTMREAKIGDGLLESGATDQFVELADARTADSMAAQGAIGIADLLVQQLAGREARTK